MVQFITWVPVRHLINKQHEHKLMLINQVYIWSYMYMWSYIFMHAPVQSLSSSGSRPFFISELCSLSLHIVKAFLHGILFVVDNLVWCDWVGVVVLRLSGTCWTSWLRGTPLWLQLSAGEGCVMLCLGVTCFKVIVKCN